MSDLEDVKVGDLVIISRSGYYVGSTVEKVTRVSKTQLTTKTGRYMKQTGRMVGGHGFHIPFAQAGTEERLAQTRLAQERRELSRKLSDVIWRDLPVEVLRGVSEKLEELTK